MQLETQIKLYDNALKNAFETSAANLKESFQNMIQSMVDNSCSNVQGIVKEMEQKAKEELDRRLESCSEYVEKLQTEAIDRAQSDSKKIIDDAKANAKATIDSANSEKEQIISNAQKRRDEIISQVSVDKSALEKGVSEIRTRNESLIDENAKLKEELFTLNSKNGAITSELKEQKDEHERCMAGKNNEIANLIEQLNTFKELQVKLDASKKSVEEFSKLLDDYYKMDEAQKQKEMSLDERELRLDTKEEMLTQKDGDLTQRENDLDEVIKERSQELFAIKDTKIESLENALKDTQDNIASQSNILTAFNNFKAQFGNNDPIKIIEEYKRLQVELAAAMEALKNKPSDIVVHSMQEVEKREKVVDRKEEELEARKRELESTLKNYGDLQMDRNNLNEKIRCLQNDIEFYKSENDKLRVTYETPTNRDERIKVINTPLFTPDNANSDERADIEELEKLGELGWLKNIENKISEHGYSFPQRLIYAFHTALKSAQMSPLTVLSGCSGTGKTTLPRLYSYFGGIKQLTVPVQPNWDSQEQMLGYYDSVDNCFVSEDILRFLAQTQRQRSDQYGLQDVMSIILLDEMNLANVELYFASFLSKFETRRDSKKGEVTAINVRLGSKIEPWTLPLGYNVLWCGTMNEDETTKTLSDKVLDRGIVINFPRPDKFIPYQKKDLGNPEKLLPKGVWEDWTKIKTPLPKDERDKYIQRIENINKQMNIINRGLGQRVWNSIECYMSLYPGVQDCANEKDRLRAIENAFEDQFVQKVVPKLRGIETDGEQGKVLDAIKGFTPDSLKADFDKACDKDIGQFTWKDSSYLLGQKNGK